METTNGSGPSLSRRAVLWTLLSAVLWGTSFVANDFAVEVAPWATFTWARLLVAALSTLALLRWAEGSFRLDLLARREIWILSAANTAGFLFQYWGQTLTTPAKTSLIVNSNVLVVALLGVIFLGERIPLWKGVSLLGALLGLFLVTTGGDPERLRGGEGLGGLLVVLSSISWGVYIVGTKEATSRTTPLSLAAWTLAESALLALPIVLLVDGGPAPMDAVAWGWALYTGVVCSTIAFLLWIRSLPHLSATSSSLLLLAEVLVALLLSWSFGREGFEGWEVVGFLALLGSIVLVGWESPKETGRSGEPEGSALPPPGAIVGRDPK